MKTPVQKAFVLVVGVVVMLVAGCAEQEPPTVKRSRLIAAENMQLQKEFTQHAKEIERLNERHDRQMKEQKELLAKCLEEKETWKKKSLQNVRNQAEGVLDAAIEQNAQLSEENEQLKVQLEQVKAELQRLETKIKEITTP